MPGGLLDRQDDAFDQFNRLGEYSEDRCRYDGFYGAKTHWTSRLNTDGSRTYAGVQTKSVRAQEREA
eukprot:6620589-Prymnesium_polylepis.1